MKNILLNILAVLAGLFIGGFINSTIIEYSSNIVALPEGVVPGDLESLKANIHRFELKNFVPVFLAHALGTLVGAIIATLIAQSSQLKFAMAIGCIFLLGGIAMVTMLPTPTWYIFTDLLGAYIPMAYLGWIITGKK